MNVLDFPVRLDHFYASDKVDAEIVIYDGDIALIADHEAYKGPGRVFFAWSPSASVNWQISGGEKALPFSALGPVNLIIPGYENQIQARVTSIDSSSNEGQRVFGRVENAEGRKTIEPLKHVEFYLANFPSFLGSAVRNKQGTEVSASRATLKDRGWAITIDGIWEGSTRRHDIDGHFFLSHVCRLEREDGGTFTSREAADLLASLYWFFSFCRGAATPAILPLGFNADGNQVWCEWGSWNISRYQNKRNWFNDFSAEALEKTYSGFIERLDNESLKQSTQLSVYWYLEAEKAGSDSAIILIQAAFELLAWSFFVEQQRKYSPESFERTPSRELLPQLLLSIPIELEIPATLGALRQTAADQGWADGPTALFGIRNALLHPTIQNRRSYDTLTPMSLFEAAQLALWYLEMILLWSAGYSGRYANRLVLSGWRGQEVEHVPWARPSGAQVER
jgi:hypothetical protein